MLVTENDDAPSAENVLTKAIRSKTLERVDVHCERREVRFRWDAAKASANAERHGVTFEQAARVFFDPFVRYMDASMRNEVRDGAIGMDFEYRLVFVVHLEIDDDAIRIISAWPATAQERRTYEAGYDS